MQPGRAWGARGSAGDTRLHESPSISAVSFTHASQWNFDRQKPCVWQRGNRAPSARSDRVGVRMRQAVSDNAVKAVTATIRGATPLCSRGRTTTRIPAGEGLGAGLRRFRFRRWFTRLRLCLGVRGRAAAVPTEWGTRDRLLFCLRRKVQPPPPAEPRTLVRTGARCDARRCAFTCAVCALRADFYILQAAFYMLHLACCLRLHGCMVHAEGGASGRLRCSRAHARICT